MARDYLRRLFPIALPVAALAAALQIERRKIDAAIKNGLLPVYQIGTNKRVLVKDAVTWIEKHWSKVK